MKILFAASEVNPLIKVGGIADVVGSLAQEMKKAGHDVRIIIPFYKPLKEKKINPLKDLGSVEVNLGQDSQRVNIFQTTLFGKIPVYLLDNKVYLSGDGVYLSSESFSSISRFIFFSVGVLEMLTEIGWRPDIIHAHDWQTGIIPLLLKLRKSKIKCLFTIHNLLIQGKWNYFEVLDFLGLKGDEMSCLKQKVPGAYGDDFDVMQQAISCADLITTVSPSYAREIKTRSYQARGLSEVIRQREQDIYGILNGLNVDIFNPETDSFIKKHYSIKSLQNKLINKLDLQKKIGFKQSPNTPLLSVISRLDVQKGIDLISQAIDKIFDLGCQFVFLSVGEKKYEDMLMRAARKYPRDVAVYLKFDPILAQQIYAGADIFLMPSRFEPCGLSQLIAMRYGTIPIVRPTGGLIDTVENIKIRSNLFGLIKKISGTGFTFVNFTVEKFVTTVERALKIYSCKSLWRQLQINAMKQDFSWRQSAKKYLGLYKKLLEK